LNTPSLRHNPENFLKDSENCLKILINDFISLKIHRFERPCGDFLG